VSTGASRRRTRPVIAIDGPGGSGKSTVAREVARRLGWRYLDSGAMYRAVTLAALDTSTAVSDARSVADIARRAELTVSTDPDDPWTEVGGRRVTTEIRRRAVTNAVSAVSAVPEVRALLLAEQRRIIGAGAIVVEGRDIGTTVVPDAELKLFLTADAAARASRRHRDDAAPEAVDLTVTHAEINRRDELDRTRAASPLSKAVDAIEIDTTSMTVDEVVSTILSRCADLGMTDQVTTQAEA
jgi:cytidylate kinase